MENFLIQMYSFCPFHMNAKVCYIFNHKQNDSSSIGKMNQLFCFRRKKIEIH